MHNRDDSKHSTVSTKQSSCLDFAQCDYEHLVEWIGNVCYSGQNIPTQLTMEGIYLSQALQFIMNQVNSEAFKVQQSREQFQSHFVDYFSKQFGIIVKPLLTGKNKKQIILPKLVLYVCIYSENKEEFVSKIMKLPIQTQEKLVQDIECMENELSKLQNDQNLMENWRQLEKRNIVLSQNLIKTQEKLAESERVIQKLMQELEKAQQQTNSYVLQKRRTLNGFALSNMSEYRQLCKKLNLQNEILIEREQKLIEMIKNLQQENLELVRQVEVTYLELNSKSQLSIIKEDQQKNPYNEKFIIIEEQNTSIKDSFVDSNFSQTYQSTNNKTKIIKTFEQSFGSLCQKKKIFGFNFSDTFFQISNRRCSKNTARDIFNITKTKIDLHDKIAQCQQTIEQQQHIIHNLEDQIQKKQKKQRFLLKRLRKIENLSDKFLLKYEKIEKKIDKYDWDKIHQDIVNQIGDIVLRNI